MQDGKTIVKLHNVFEGRFHTGHLASVGGRHSDGFVCYLSGGAEYIHDGFSFSVEAGGVFTWLGGAVTPSVSMKIPTISVWILTLPNLQNLIACFPPVYRMPGRTFAVCSISGRKMNRDGNLG